MAYSGLNKYQKTSVDPDFEQFDQAFQDEVEHRLSSSNNTSRRSLHSIRSRSSQASGSLASPTINSADDLVTGCGDAFDEIAARHSHSAQQHQDAQRPIFAHEAAETSAHAARSQGLVFEREILFEREDGAFVAQQTLLDSGCKAGNYVPEVFVRDFLNKKIEPLAEGTSPGRSATHQDIPVVGQVTLRYKVGNHPNKTTFLVDQGSGIGMILGQKEIKAHPWLIEGSDDFAGPIAPARKPGEIDKKAAAQRAKQAAESKANEERRKQKAKQDREAVQQQKKTKK